jgi:hypothetical protein
MKNLILFLMLAGTFYPLLSQVSNADIMQGNGKDTGDSDITATLTASSRLFGNPDDLTSVILIIPKGSRVEVLDSDSTYLYVYFEENEGYILRRHATIDKRSAPVQQQAVARVPVREEPVRQQQTVPQQKQTQPQPQTSRFAYLESKYGTSMAARINSGKIWKGMNAEMVRDSWGKADRISREISGNTVKEEWIYRNTWLYLENNTLVQWGPVRD